MYEITYYDQKSGRKSNLFRKFEHAQAFGDMRARQYAKTCEGAVLVITKMRWLGEEMYLVPDVKEPTWARRYDTPWTTV